MKLRLYLSTFGCGVLVSSVREVFYFSPFSCCLTVVLEIQRQGSCMHEQSEFEQDVQRHLSDRSVGKSVRSQGHTHTKG